MTTGYAMLGTGELRNDVDVEHDDAEVIEATLSWGDNVLVTKHFALTAAISVGEAPGCDFSLPAELVGDERVNVVSPATGSAFLHAPHGATVVMNGQRRMAGSLSNPVELRRGEVADVHLGDFTLTLAMVRAGRKPAGALAGQIKESALGSVGISAFMHAAIFASLALFLPGMNADDAEGMSRDQMYVMRAYLDAAAEREKEPPPEEADPGATAGASDPGAGGGRAKDAEGGMGKPTATGQAHYSARGDARPSDVTLAREQALVAAKDFGMVHLLGAYSVADPDAPVVPWGSVLNGMDKESHMGNLWSGDIGDAFGSGLGLTGTGEGGGGKNEGIGINDIGGLGRSLDTRLGMGTCVGPGPCAGGNGDHGIGHGIPRGHHVPGGPSVRPAKEFEASGHLPAEVIQRIVRQNSGRFRNCYESGLRGNPSLAGRVAVKFVIDREGGVSLAGDSGSDLPDNAVRECVVRSFYSLSFPAPANGTVKVIYPLLFSPES